MTFPPASLPQQLAELKREQKMRSGVYPHWIETRKIKPEVAAYQTNALAGAITTLETLVRATGQPGRRELIEALRRARERFVTVHGDHDGRAELDELLARVPE
jgi:hypothetical protein